jgi:hypothetical protein
MPPSQRSPRVMPSFDVAFDDDEDDFEDRTIVEHIPWHRERSEPSGLRAVPRPAPRPEPQRVPRPAPRLVPPPPPTPEPRPEPPLAQAIVRWSEPVLSEDVETLSLPYPLREDMLPVGARPEGAAQTRIAIIRVVRTLGHDYRRHRKCLLRTDVAAIETTQRQLLGLATEVAQGRLDPRALATEVARHGALLGEIVARRLGGVWTDVSGDHPERWSMSVSPCTVFAPIARVHRFLVQRNREQDLVGFFLDLHAANRSLA